MAWYDNFEPDLKEHLTAKGWDKLEADAAARAAALSQREAEKYIGAPPDQIVRLPKGADDPSYNEFWDRVSSVGRPKEAAGYELGELKLKDGTAAGDEFVKWAKETAHKYGLPASVAKGLASDVISYNEGTQAQGARESEAKLGAEAAFLRQNWGGNYEFNEFLAKKGAEALGLDKEFVDALQKTAGFSKVMEGLRLVGTRISEPELHRGESGGNQNGHLTRAEALDRKAKLMADTSWTQRFLNGDAKAREEMDNLNRTIVGPAPVIQ